MSVVYIRNQFFFGGKIKFSGFDFCFGFKFADYIVLEFFNIKSAGKHSVIAGVTARKNVAKSVDVGVQFFRRKKSFWSVSAEKRNLFEFARL